MYWDQSTCMYCDDNTCMYFDHSISMCYHHGTCTYYDHSIWKYYDHSTVHAWSIWARAWRKTWPCERSYGIWDEALGWEYTLLAPVYRVVKHRISSGRDYENLSSWTSHVFTAWPTAQKASQRGSEPPCRATEPEPGGGHGHVKDLTVSVTKP